MTGEKIHGLVRPCTGTAELQVSMTCWHHWIRHPCSPHVDVPDSPTSTSSTMDWSPSSIHQPSEPLSRDPTEPIYSPTLSPPVELTTESTRISRTPHLTGTACLRMWQEAQPSSPSSPDYPLFQTKSPFTESEADDGRSCAGWECSLRTTGVAGSV